MTNSRTTVRNHFDTSHLLEDLKGRTVRGGVATFGAQVASFILNLGSTVILARMLTPADFGLVAMVTAVTGFVAMFKDAGLSMATVQQDVVTHEQVSTLFWINVLLSVLVMLVVAALAPVVAWFYHEPRLALITLAISSVFIFDGLTVQHQALLCRQMRFGALALIQIISRAGALTVAVVLAFMGAGYWALIAQLAAQQILFAIFCWLNCRWFPGRPRRGVGTRSMLKFGGYLTGFSFVNYFARNADNTLIGYAWGGSALGLYAKAYSLLLLPLSQINAPIAATAAPALSRLQDNPEQFRLFFVKILSVITFVTFPLVAWMIVCRREIILIFLGPQWEGAIPIFTALAVSAFVQPIGNISGLLYTTLGRTKRMFQWGLMACPWLVFSFFVGLPYGALGVALSYSIATVLMIYPLVRFSTSGTCIELHHFFDGIKYPMYSTLAMTAIGTLVHYLFSWGGVWFTFTFSSLSMFLSYFLMSYRINTDLIHYAKQLVLKKV
ncbi:lipopolysaccharide biosynthesis protein [Desulfobulbus rhabdoformis]|uniref:lipopolysaccharide biosynthesis protein n=1 Tax=Desulfobulbus rhabdoformis TaxID=34032 RepID=UPI001966CD41|nr:lipopolysaccharide biosynthesis protein [Desulfobulbus rhabdoformis]MBM9612702.1 lipopolysaccharide biosynthesis protein [Desulfobulbus rhabdoformis]